MNRTLLAVIAGALAILLPAPAIACTTIKPKTWKGNIQFAHHATVGSQDFILNGCKFHDARLNGLDTRVFDVASHRGLKATAKWTTTTPARPDRVTGIFRTATCAPINVQWSQPTMGKTVGFTIPSAAKWMIVAPYTLAPSKDIAVTVYSPGRKCPT